MTILGIAQILIFFALVVAITKPVGSFMFRVFRGRADIPSSVLRPVERLIYWLGGVSARTSNSPGCAIPHPSFRSACSAFCSPMRLQRLQGLLPLNPQQFSTAGGARRMPRP